MRKISFCGAFFVFMAVYLSAFAQGPYLVYAGGPFLVCDPADPAENIVSYKIYRDGVFVAQVDTDPTGVYGCKYDLAGAEKGAADWTLVAVDDQGVESDPSEALYMAIRQFTTKRFETKSAKVEHTFEEKLDFDQGWW